MKVITIARKPLIGSVAQTALKYGTGGLNIDGCRIPMKLDDRAEYKKKRRSFRGAGTNQSFIPFNVSPILSPEVKIASSVLGRFPANLILQHLPECQEENCAEGCPVGSLNDLGVTSSGATKREISSYEGDSNTGFLRGDTNPRNQHDDSGSVARFFKQVKG